LARAAASDPRLAAATSELGRAAQARAHVAVLPLSNSSGRPADAWLAGGIAESLSGDLRKLGVPQVERLAIDKLLTEQRFTALFSTTGGGSAEVEAVGKKLGAQALVVGSYATVGERLRIDARLVDIASQAVLLADSVEGPSDTLFALETELAMRLGRQLNPQVSDADRRALEAGHGSLQALEQRQRALLGQGGTAAPTAEAEGARAAAVREAPQVVAGRMAAAGTLALPVAGGPAPVAPPRTTAIRALLESRVVEQGDRLRLDVRLVDPRSGAVLASTSIEGLREQLGRLEAQAAQTLIQKVGALPPLPAKRGAR
jgi:TolB-like protein